MKVQVVVGRDVTRAAPSRVRDLVKAVSAVEGLSGSMVVALLSEPEMSELNERFRGVHGPTDVLSFRQDDGEAEWPEPAGAEESVLGEVVVCPAVVERYSLEEDGDPSTQLGRTLVHGVLHLVGYDHESDEGQMLEREQALVDELGSEVRAVSSSPGR